MNKILDDPAFSLKEAAAIARVREERVRDLFKRGLSSWVGMKRGHHIMFSAREIAILAIAVDMVAVGFAPAAAGRIASALLYEAPDGDRVVKLSPVELAHQRSPGPTYREAAREPEATAVLIELPVGAIWNRVLAECQSLYEREAA